MTTPNGTRRARFLLAGLAILAGASALVVLNGPLRPNTELQAQTAKALLMEVRTTRTISALPPDILHPLPDVGDPEVRKSLFIAALLPYIVRENARIADQRSRAMAARENSPEFAALAYAYGLEPGASRERLLRRIDIVPASLALAQGAIESAWGTSRFAREANAYFGERTYDEEAEGLVPSARLYAGFKVKSFANPGLSVRSFMNTLNTHPAYRAFREQRAKLRKMGETPSGLALAPFLHGYSEIGDAYVRRIVLTIKINGLSDYNNLVVRRD